MDEEYSSLGPQEEQLPDGHPSLYPPHATGLNFGEQAVTGVPLSCKLSSSYSSFQVIGYNNNLNKFVQLICFINFAPFSLTKDVTRRPKYRELLMHPFILRYEEKQVDVGSWLEGVLAQAPLQNFDKLEI